MQALFYSQARNNLRSIINKACTDFEQFIVTTKDIQSVVIMSHDEYSAIQETMYLLSSRNNRERLLDAVEEIEQMKFITKEMA